MKNKLIIIAALVLGSFVVGHTAIAITAGVPITVPSAPGAGYALQSTTTGAYVATSTGLISAGSNVTITGGPGYVLGPAISISATGGGGTPGGSSGQLQYNASGSFGGVATTTLTGSGVITISNAPVLIGATPAVATLTGGSNGQVLGWLGGVPTWTASSSVAAGTVISVSAAGSVSTVTNTGVTSLAGTANQVAVSGSTGAVTLSLPPHLIQPSLLLTTGSTTNATTTGSQYFSFLTGSTQCLQVDTTGKLSGTGVACGSGGGSGFPFAVDTNFNSVVYSTSTPTLWFKSGLYASSTSYLSALNIAGLANGCLQITGGLVSSSGASCGGSGSQSPWTQPIDGAGFNLANVGTIGIGTSSPYQGALTVDSGAASTTNTYLTGNVNSFLELNIQNRNGGASASSDFVATANNGTPTTRYVDFGINGSGGGGQPYTTANHAYLYSIDDPLNIGSLGNAGYIAFQTTGGLTPVERVRIDTTGNVGIGTTTPFAALQIGTTTGKNLVLSDTSAGANLKHWLLSSQGGNLYIGTTSDAYGTSTNPALTFMNNGRVGVGSSTPWGEFSINAVNLGNAPAFVVGSSSGSGTTTVITNNGSLGVATSSPTATFSVSGNSYLSGPVNIQSNSATAFSIGALGTTSVGFLVNNAAPGNGVTFTNSAPGSGVSIGLTSAATNENLTISQKAAGTLGIGNASGGTITVDAAAASTFQVRTASTARLAVTQSTIALTPTVALSTAATKRFNFTGAADTALTASTEAQEVVFDLGQVRTHATGAITQQRDFRITASTHAYNTGTNAANTIASGTALSIDGPPTQGALANFTNVQALFLGPGGLYTSASTTNAFGLVIQAPVGAANNYAASTTGRIVHNNLTSSGTGNAVCITTANEITNAGGGTCTPSSIRFKEDVRILDFSALDIIQGLKPVTFRYKKGYGDEGKQERIGLVAEDVEKVEPRLVEYAADGKPNGLHFEEFAGLYAKAFQEQQAQIDALKGGVVTAARSVEENWQWWAILLLFAWNLYLTVRRKK